MVNIRIHYNDNAMPSLFIKELPPAQQEIWPMLAGTPEQFVLYGGTALALRLGHRQSVDFDFFTSAGFYPSDLEKRIAYLVGTERIQSSENTLVSLIKTQSGVVKISFFGGLGFGRVGKPLIAKNRIRIASMLDLAATKIKVLQDRAEVKDYIDICALVNNGITLDAAISAAMGIYGESFNPLISLRALTYFEDGNVSKLAEPERKLLLNYVSELSLGGLYSTQLQSKDLAESNDPPPQTITEPGQ